MSRDFLKPLTRSSCTTRRHLLVDSIPCHTSHRIRKKGSYHMATDGITTVKNCSRSHASERGGRGTNFCSLASTGNYSSFKQH